MITKQLNDLNVREEDNNYLETIEEFNQYNKSLEDSYVMAFEAFEANRNYLG